MRLRYGHSELPNIIKTHFRMVDLALREIGGQGISRKPDFAWVGAHEPVRDIDIGSIPNAPAGDSIMDGRIGQHSAGNTNRHCHAPHRWNSQKGHHSDLEPEQDEDKRGLYEIQECVVIAPWKDITRHGWCKLQQGGQKKDILKIYFLCPRTSNEKVEAAEERVNHDD